MARGTVKGSVRGRYRRARSDRMHVLYKITNTENGNFYIGLTRRIGQATKKTMQSRFAQHVSRAVRKERDFVLSSEIRTFGSEAFKIELLEQVRGRKPAHQRERELIRAHNPVLNQA